MQAKGLCLEMLGTELLPLESKGWVVLTLGLLTREGGLRSKALAICNMVSKEKVEAQH